jgi:hypothetical protein
MSGTATHRPFSSPGQHSAGRSPVQTDDEQPGALAKGAWVEVASGPAQGARGRIVERIGGNVTLVAQLLGQRPLLLTVASTACAPLELPAERG